jgi:hypothetical protein
MRITRARRFAVRNPNNRYDRHVANTQMLSRFATYPLGLELRESGRTIFRLPHHACF